MSLASRCCQAQVTPIVVILVVAGGGCSQTYLRPRLRHTAGDERSQV